MALVGFLEHMSLLDPVRDKGCHRHVDNQTLPMGWEGHCRM
jgi:hypothetical protein